MNGREVNAPSQNGVYIMKRIFTDGSQRVDKVRLNF